MSCLLPFSCYWGDNTLASFDTWVPRTHSSTRLTTISASLPLLSQTALAFPP